MAAVARSAPVPASGAPDAAAAPPAAPELSSSLDDTLSVIKKVQIGVQEAHRAHITAEVWTLVVVVINTIIIIIISSIIVITLLPCSPKWTCFKN